jgi:hypothetical protein
MALVVSGEAAVQHDIHHRGAVQFGKSSLIGAHRMRDNVGFAGGP